MLETVIAELLCAYAHVSMSNAHARNSWQKFQVEINFCLLSFCSLYFVSTWYLGIVFWIVTKWQFWSLKKKESCYFMISIIDVIHLNSNLECYSWFTKCCFKSLKLHHEFESSNERLDFFVFIYFDFRSVFIWFGLVLLQYFLEIFIKWDLIIFMWLCLRQCA